MNKSVLNMFARVKSPLNALKNNLTWGVLYITFAALCFVGQITTMMIQIAHQGDPTYDHFAASSFEHMLFGWLFILVCALMHDSIKYKKIFNG